jgi:hypothetical protein
VKCDEIENCFSTKSVGQLPKLMMNLKLEAKLRQLLNLSIVKLIMEKYLLKMKETQVIDVCKITTMKIEDFAK